MIPADLKDESFFYLFFTLLLFGFGLTLREIFQLKIKFYEKIKLSSASFLKFWSGSILVYRLKFSRPGMN